MFSTFDPRLSTALHTQAGPHGAARFRKIPKVHDKSFVGFSGRSRNGCIGCRTKKKKCDEAYPVCSLCEKRGVECIRRNKAVTFVERKEKASFSPDFQLILNNHTVIPDLDISFSDFDPSLSDLMSHTVEMPVLTISPSNSMLVCLDETGKNFLGFYRDHVASHLSFLSGQPNHFESVFLKLASSDEAISNALAAWGGYWLRGNKDVVARKYLDKAICLMDSKVKKDLPKQEFVQLISLCLIIVGIEVSTGDVSRWAKFFDKCKALLVRFGGISQFCKDFGSLIEGKWILSNYLFHDILASSSYVSGTTFPMSEYNYVFRDQKLLQSKEYGVDPLQGVGGPLFLLLGDILNTCVKFREIPQLLSSQDRIDHFTEIETYFQDMDAKISSSVPYSPQLECITDMHMMELHLSVFELLQFTCQLYLRIGIKKMPPKLPEMQLLLLNALDRFNILLGTSLQTALCFPLLITGIMCVEEHDREDHLKRFERIAETYEVKNVERVKFIVQQSWKKNPDGSLCTDWSDVVHEVGWCLSLC